MTERFKRAYDLLVKAYFEGTLRAGDCTACAVGNICGGAVWVRALNEPLARYSIAPEKCFGPQLTAIKLSEISGYSRIELNKIENTFEGSTNFKWRVGSRRYATDNYFDNFISPTEHEILADQFNGLKAVVELMMEFDNIEGDQYVDKFKEKLQPA